MKKQLIFSAMLGLCAFGSATMYTVPTWLPWHNHRLLRLVDR